MWKCDRRALAVALGVALALLVRPLGRAQVVVPTLARQAPEETALAVLVILSFVEMALVILSFLEMALVIL